MSRARDEAVGKILQESFKEHAKVEHLTEHEKACLVYFFGAGYVDMEKAGYVLTGFSMRDNEEGSLLVVRADKGGVPLVCFISGRSWSHCLATFVARQLLDDLTWSKDKFG